MGRHPRRRGPAQRTTGEGLDDIDLGDLKDPKWYEKIVSGVAGLVGVVVDIALGPLDELIVAIATGDWATFFWELKEMLDTVLMVMAVVALFCPLTAPLVAAIFIISLVAFAVTVGLYFTQTPNPETGETVGLGDVLISGAGVALAFGGGLQAIKAARGLPSTFQYRSGLQALADTGMDIRAVLSGTGGTSPILTAHRARPARCSGSASRACRSRPAPRCVRASPTCSRAPAAGWPRSALIKDINDALPPGLPHLPGQTPTVTEPARRLVGRIVDRRVQLREQHHAEQRRVHERRDALTASTHPATPAAPRPASRSSSSRPTEP